MTKFIKHMLIQILFLICTTSIGYCLSIEGIWIPEKIHWKAPNIAGMPAIWHASVSIMQFQKDGTFKLFQYGAYKGENDSIKVAYTEDGNIFKGKWELEGNKIKVSYDEVFRSIEILRVDGKKRETHFNEIFYIETSSTSLIKINTGKINFIKSNRLTKESKEFIAKY